MAKSDSKKEIKPEPTPIPKVEAQPAPLLKEEDYPTDDKFVNGTWIHRKTKQPFALWIHEPNVYDRTHTLKNSANTWEGTEEEFFLTFEKP